MQGDDMRQGHESGTGMRQEVLLLAGKTWITSASTTGSSASSPGTAARRDEAIRPWSAASILWP